MFQSTSPHKHCASTLQKTLKIHGSESTLQNTSNLCPVVKYVDAPKDWWAPEKREAPVRPSQATNQQMQMGVLLGLGMDSLAVDAASHHPDVTFCVLGSCLFLKGGRNQVWPGFCMGGPRLFEGGLGRLLRQQMPFVTYPTQGMPWPARAAGLYGAAGPRGGRGGRGGGSMGSLPVQQNRSLLNWVWSKLGHPGGGFLPFHLSGFHFGCLSCFDSQPIWGSGHGGLTHFLPEEHVSTTLT